MMIRRGDRKYREFECSECEIKRHIYEIERENWFGSSGQCFLNLFLHYILVLQIVQVVDFFCPPPHIFIGGATAA